MEQRRYYVDHMFGIGHSAKVAEAFMMARVSQTQADLRQCAVEIARKGDANGPGVRQLGGRRVFV
jgi:hypothetical protein